ncbi:MAG: sulfotransferase [Pseudomonadota bacterium]
MNVPQRFAELVDKCAELIDGSGLIETHHTLQKAEPLPSLLERCSELVEHPWPTEPVRTIHHFACSGGTLVSKCVASMPNVQLLSEVAPHSQMYSGRSSAFAPTDLVSLLRNGSLGSDEELELEVFLQGVRAIYERCTQTGTHLVLREHTHSKYCVEEDVKDVPGLVSGLSSEYETRSIVSVRHPLDSYLSLLKRGWRHFSPNSLDEYARRYLAFLDDHEELPLVRYEDFVANSEPVMRTICSALELGFTPGFENLFSIHKLSGDSGRTSARIGRRSRRATPEEVVGQLDSHRYLELCKRLEYDPLVSPHND